MSGGDLVGVLARFHGNDFRVVLVPSRYVEQRNGALMGTGTPSVDLIDPDTGRPCYGLAFDTPRPR